MGAHRVALAALLTALAAAATGCITPEQLEAMQTDIADSKAQVEALRKQGDATAASVETLQQSAGGRETAARESSAEMNRQIQAIRDDIRVLNNRLDELQHRVSGLSQSAPRAPEPAAPSGGDTVGVVPVPARPGGGGGGSAEDLFNEAYADYSKGNYAPAILGFEDYLQRYPTSDKADDALYWIGLCHYDQGEYQDAIAQFDRVLQQFPNGDKVAASQLKKGLSLLEMNRTAQGVVQLQALIERDPRSEEARIARDRLKEIGVKP